MEHIKQLQMNRGEIMTMLVKEAMEQNLPIMYLLNVFY